MNDQTTPDQKAELQRLSEQTGQPIPDNLTSEAAAEKIAELRAKAGHEADATDQPVHTPITPNANR